MVHYLGYTLVMLPAELMGLCKRKNFLVMNEIYRLKGKNEILFLKKKVRV